MEDITSMKWEKLCIQLEAAFSAEHFSHFLFTKFPIMFSSSLIGEMGVAMAGLGEAPTSNKMIISSVLAEAGTYLQALCHCGHCVHVFREA